MLYEAYELSRSIVTAQAINKLSTFYDSPTFNAMFTRSRNWPYKPDESNPYLQSLFIYFVAVPPLPHTSPRRGT